MFIARDKDGTVWAFSKEPRNDAHFTLPLEDGTYFSIFCKTKREKLIVNGLYNIDNKK